MRLTINNINSKLPEGYELIKDRSADCFYFTYPKGVTWYSSCVYTNLLNTYSLNEWIDLFNSMREENETEVKPYTGGIIKLSYNY